MCRAWVKQKHKEKHIRRHVRETVKTERREMGEIKRTNFDRVNGPREWLDTETQQQQDETVCCMSRMCKNARATWTKPVMAKGRPT